MSILTKLLLYVFVSTTFAALVFQALSVDASGNDNCYTIRIVHRLMALEDVRFNCTNGVGYHKLGDTSQYEWTFCMEPNRPGQKRRKIYRYYCGFRWGPTAYQAFDVFNSHKKEAANTEKRSCGVRDRLCIWTMRDDDIDRTTFSGGVVDSSKMESKTHAYGWVDYKPWRDITEGPFLRVGE